MHKASDSPVRISNLYKSTLENPASTSSLWSGRDPDRSMRSKLQSCLEHLDKHRDNMIGIYREILEIRACIVELLTNCEPEVAMGDEGPWESWDSRVDLQAVIDDNPLTIVQEPLPFHGRLSDLEFGPLEAVGVASTLQESIYLVDQLPQELLPCSTSSYEPAAGDVLPQHGTCPDGQTSSGSSSRLDEQLPLTVVQGVQEKVKCTWSGCSRVVKKDSLTRHVNEMHRRRIKVVCSGCGKGFARPYMMKNHNCREKRRNS
ncbi:hypothetical protein F4604DRAFT_182998 [Suillus subluteus]|nr:hypothetical protein F4604DRAFT_182998 [Suillus subluteus]